MREAQMPGPARPGQYEHSFGNVIQNSESVNDMCANFGIANLMNEASCYTPMMVPSSVQNHEASQDRPYTPENMGMNCM